MNRFGGLCLAVISALGLGAYIGAAFLQFFVNGKDVALWMWSLPAVCLFGVIVGASFTLTEERQFLQAVKELLSYARNIQEAGPIPQKPPKTLDSPPESEPSSTHR